MSLSEAVQFGLENRRELKQAGLDIDNQSINVQYAKNQMLPVLDITASYAHSGLGGTQTIRSGFGQGSEILQVIPGGAGDMFRQLFGLNYPGYSAGFLEVRNAHTQVEMNRAKAAVARTARELSTRRLDAEQKKFELGASTVRFVLEEQRNLAQAETNELQALVNYSKALVTFDRAIGNTLARNHIDFDKQLPIELNAR
jgi:outer membrane protein TolC